MTGAEKKNIVQQLQQEILMMQGYGMMKEEEIVQTGLGPIEQSFPGKSFPKAAVHEFISSSPWEAAATNGFLSGIVSALMDQKKPCLWISTQRTLFPPGLAHFGINPERVIFIDLRTEQEVLWAVEQALKCGALGAVVGELKELSFTESRRLQLAVEQSKVTGFIHRRQPRQENNVACISRWKISPILSEDAGNVPGMGFYRWNVALLKVRNGYPGNWQLEWRNAGFRPVAAKRMAIPKNLIHQAG